MITGVHQGCILRHVTPHYLPSHHYPIYICFGIQFKPLWNHVWTNLKRHALSIAILCTFFYMQFDLLLFYSTNHIVLGGWGLFICHETAQESIRSSQSPWLRVQSVRGENIVPPLLIDSFLPFIPLTSTFLPKVSLQGGEQRQNSPRLVQS